MDKLELIIKKFKIV